MKLVASLFFAGAFAKVVQILTDANFDAIVMDKDKDVLVEFYAPWCGHCKRLEPVILSNCRLQLTSQVYDTVAEDFADDEHVVIAKLNADDHGKAAKRFGIQGYPTIKLFPANKKDKPVDYMSAREEKDFVEFMNEHTGTYRVPGGGLNSFAGRIGNFDKTAKAIGSATGEKLLELIQEARAAVNTYAESASDKGYEYYLRVYDKLSTNPEWVKTEYARLNKILKNPSGLTKDKLDAMRKKRNVLSSFVGAADKDEL